MSNLKTREKLKKLFDTLDADDRLLIVIFPDPDAIASAWALKRLIRYKVQSVDIAALRETKRLDNLAMIRLLRIPILRFEECQIEIYTKLAIVDSQPHHFAELEGLSFDILIDHHPVDREFDAAFQDINPTYGATATILTEYLRAAKIKPSTYLATALFYGIKTDTQNFVLRGIEKDIQAFRYLFNYINQTILRKIETSELSLKNLSYFKKAFNNMEVNLRRHRVFLFLGKVESPDICVILADFLLRIYEISWSIVAGIYEETVVIIFRSDGYRRDAGQLATKAFGEIGKAGGHKEMARAEIPLANLSPFISNLSRSKAKRIKEIKAYVKGRIKEMGL